jgi:competence protein ComEC
LWDCGSARIALIVLIGTGLSASASPECWLPIAAFAGICLVIFRCRLRASLLRSSETQDYATPPLASRDRESGESGRCSNLRLRTHPLTFAADGFLALFFISTVALSASLRIEADARHSHILAERVACVRGTVVGFPQPSRYGTDLVLSSLSPDSLYAPLPRGTRVLVKVRGRSLRVSPGDTLTLAGLLRSPLGTRNPGGFSEAAYLFQSRIRAVLTVPAFLRPVVRRADPPRGFLAIYMAPVHMWIERAIDRYVPGEERAFLLALVLGERGELTDELKDAFRQSGIIHLISVSGLHTGLVAMIAFLFLKGVRLSSRASLVGSALIVWFYCGISGCSPPTLRSSVMVTCVVSSRLLGRGTGLVSPLCTSCAILLLINPRYITDVGFQLSYAATGSMLAGASLGKAIKRWLSPPEWIWKYVLSTVLTTIVAQMGVLPILAFQFGSVSAVSIPANLLAIPVASGALVSSFCSLGFFAVAPPLAASSFSLTWLLLRLCNLIAKLASSVPGASIELMKPTSVEAVSFMACFFVFLRAAGSRRAIPESARQTSTPRSLLTLVVPGLGMALCLILFAGGKIPAMGSREKSTEVYFLDVGQGDATAIRLPDARLLLIDGGESVENWDSAKRVLIPFLRDARKKAFDMVFVTHFHSDHVGGIMRLLEEGRVGRLLVARADTTTALSHLTHLLAQEKGIDVDFVGAPDTIVKADGIELVVLHPSGFASADTSFASINDSSMVLVLHSKTAQFVLTGDAGPQVMDRVADLIESGKVTVLKAPHHGGKGTLSVHFLEKVLPGYAVFSVGRNNRFGHPAKEIVRTYKKSGTKILRTDIDGCASFSIVGDSLTVKTADPAMGLSFLQKAKSRRGERKLKLFALLSGMMDTTK